MEERIKCKVVITTSRAKVVDSFNYTTNNRAESRIAGRKIYQALSQGLIVTTIPENANCGEIVQ